MLSESWLVSLGHRTMQWNILHRWHNIFRVVLLVLTYKTWYRYFKISWFWKYIFLCIVLTVKQTFVCTIPMLGSQVKVQCSVATSWETDKLLLQLMFYLNVLFQNTWSYIKWWLYMYYWLSCKNSHSLR